MIVLFIACVFPHQAMGNLRRKSLAFKGPKKGTWPLMQPQISLQMKELDRVVFIIPVEVRLNLLLLKPKPTLRLF